VSNGTQGRGAWGSRMGFILAAAGSAVGLGNIWKFPYITGENGGGLFVIIYLVCIALVGIPIMVGEIMIGRAARRQPVGAFEAIQGKRTGWSFVGWMGVICGFIILSYYIVVAGWAMDYTLKSAANYSAPISAQAAQTATDYRAKTPVDDMRTMLSGRMAAKGAKDEVTRVRNGATQAEWTRADSVHAAVGKAGSDAEAARARLYTEPGLEATVVKVDALKVQIKEVEQKAGTDAATHYRTMADAQVIAEATDVVRRRELFAGFQKVFGGLYVDGWTGLFWAALFMLVTILVVATGVSKGIERACMILMPTLIAILVLMVIVGMFSGGFGEAMAFVFKPDPSKLKASGVLEALGHAFFTLSLGMGAMITYGSYQQGKDNLLVQGGLIALVDTGVALLACMAMFPIVFAFGQDPAAGPGLVFMSIPLAFAEMGAGGPLLSILFFGLLVLAALTSAISLLEVVASYFIDQRGWSRKKAGWILGGIIFLFGIPSAFAADPDFAMASWAPGFGKNFFDTMDYLASNWMLPLGGLLIAIYVGWVMPAKVRDAELEGTNKTLALVWLWTVRIVAPALVLLVLLQKVGFLDADAIMARLFG
jgi:SNF family Na+-dependent transporter